MHFADQIESMQEAGDAFARKIEHEKTAIAELESKLQLAREKMREADKRLGGVNMPTESVRKQERALHRIENQLEKTMIRLNETLATNRALRDEINTLRRERLQRMEAKKCLEAELAQQKQELASVIEASQTAYDARDEVQRQIEALRETIATEVQEFEVEWRQKMKDLEEDAKAKRSQREREAAVQARAVAKGKDLRHQSAKTLWDIARREVDLKRQKEKVKSYEEAFERMKKETGIESVEEMVQAFVESEERNFSMVTMINELQKEVEALEGECAELKANIEKFKGQDEEADAQRRKVFEELQSKIDKCQASAQQYETRHMEAVRAIDALKPGIWAVFEVVGCANPTMAAQLASTGVTDGNLMQFLGIIEQRLTEIIQLQHLHLSKESGADPADLLQEAEALPKSRAGRASVRKPALPALSEFEDDTEGEREQPVDVESVRKNAAAVTAAAAAPGEGEGKRTRKGTRRTTRRDERPG